MVFGTFENEQTHRESVPETREVSRLPEATPPSSEQWWQPADRIGIVNEDLCVLSCETASEEAEVVPL